MAMVFTVGVLLLVFIIAIPSLALYYIVINSDYLSFLAVKDKIQHDLEEDEKADLVKNLEAKYGTDGLQDGLEGKARSFIRRLGFLMVGYETQVFQNDSWAPVPIFL